MKNKDALALLDEIRKCKNWLPNAWGKKFLEDIDFTVRIAKQVNISEKQGIKLTELYQQATDYEINRKKPDNLQV